MLENALDYEGLKHYDGKSKEYIGKKIEKLNSEKVDKTTVATSSTLGLVKSGTDITVDSSGNVSVNDNSHKHTVSNISDLTATASELNVLDGITATTTELNYVDGVTSNIQTQLNSKVPTARKVNGKALSSDITLSASDVGADASGSASSALSDAKEYTDSKIASEVTARNSAIDTAKSSAISTASTDATTKANNALASAKTYTDTKTANLASTSTVDDKISAHNTSTSAHSDIRGSISTLQTEVTTHKNTSNPHGINKSTIGLGNVENKSSATIRSEITKDNVTSALSYTPIDAAKKGAANGLAELDANGKVPSSQLPSYVDDVIEGYLYNGKFYKESAHTTVITGEGGKIYVDLSTNKTYRWSGSAYAVISETLALGETSSTAYRGDRGKIAYDHSQSAHFSGNYNDLTNKPTIPTVGNGTITITQNGVSKGTFTTNQSGNTTIELTDTNTDTEYTLPEAGSSLGGVKSGGDVTISGGVITVNDDSHNHVISNIDGLQSALDGKASILSDMTKFPVNYGFAVARCGNTIGTSGGSDNYYMLADSSNDFRVGTQLNGASTVTWTKFSKDGHTHNDKLNKAVTVLGAMTDKTITDLQNSLDEWLKTCYDTPNSRATFTANNNFISLWNNSDTTNKISAGASWTVEIETYYTYDKYTLIKLTTYTSASVYYVEKKNGVWGQIKKVSFDGETATSASKLTSSAGSSKQPVYFDGNGKPVAISYTIEKSVPSNAVFTDTHYTTGLKVGASATATANAAATNGNVYLNVLDNTTVRDSHKIVGSGSVTVTSDANGVITINGTDTNDKYTHPTYTARTGKPTANQTPAFGGTATVSQITSDGTGHVTGMTDRTITIPSTLSNGTGTAGLIKTTSTVTSNSGYTACPVINGVPYYKDTDSNTDTKNTAGSTDSSSKLFLIGATSQAANPQTYSHDTAYVETDGHLYSNSKQVVNLSDSQALTNKTYNGYTLGDACAKGVSTTPTSGDSNLITSGAMYTALAGKLSASGTAANASKLNGKSLLNYDATDTWEGIPYISSNGIMEVGKYIDFHTTDGNTSNYDARITATTDGLTLSGKTSATLQAPVMVADNGGVAKTIIGLHNPTPDNPTTDGSELTLSGSGNTFIGGGESPFTIRNGLIALKGTTNATHLDETSYDQTYEQMYVCSDSHLWFYSNADTFENRKCILFNREGQFIPFYNGAYSLGSTAHKWGNVYADRVNDYKLADACARGVKSLTEKGSAGFGTGTNVNYLPDITFISRWDGRFNDEADTNSNLTYCYKGKFGDASVRGVDTTPTDSSSNLITSGAMYSALTSKLGKTESAASATKVYSTAVNPTDTYYAIPVHEGNTSGNKSIVSTNGFIMRSKAGTASTDGVIVLTLGNETPSGTDGNKYGAVNIYGKTAYRAQINAGSPTKNRVISLPDSDGTLSISSSDIRLKENIKDTEEQNALSIVNSIKFRQFDWKESGKHQKIGVIADELETIDEHLVLENTGGYYEETDEDGNSVMNVKCVDTFYLMGYYGKAIQELSAENTTLKEEIKELKDLVLTLINK